MIGTPNSTTARGYVVHSDEAPAFWQIGNLWRVMATGVQTGNSFCLLDQLVMANGGGPCTHSHTQDEGLYVVSGHCTFYAWGLTISAGPGEFVAVPRYAEHAFTVDAPDTQLINFYLPAGFEILLMAEFERSLIRERTQAGLAAALRIGRTGGRPPKLTDEDIEAAKAMLANPDIGVTQIAHRLGVSPATLYRYIPAARAANTSTI